MIADARDRGQGNSGGAGCSDSTLQGFPRGNASPLAVYAGGL
jgi:hypothetical protein